MDITEKENTKQLNWSGLMKKYQKNMEVAAKKKKKIQILYGDVDWRKRWRTNDWKNESAGTVDTESESSWDVVQQGNV